MISYYQQTKNSINNFYMDENNNILDILDIGSRGQIPKEWDWFLRNQFKLKINTFDIDLKANLEEKDNIIYINHKCGLASNKSPKKLYICEEPSQSSCYKPNKDINVFEKKHYKKRLNFQEITTNNISTIDNLLINKEKIDFIKCDTQGSEYDITLGAKESLLKFCPIVALETWCEDVYKNAPLDFKIRSIYRELGYKLFATDTAAAWRYETNNLFPLSKQRLIGENLLFVPSLKMFDKIKDREIETKLPILCFFGFYDYAYTLIKRKGLIKYLPRLKNLYQKFSNKRKLHRRIIQKILGGGNIFPRIT